MRAAGELRALGALEPKKGRLHDTVPPATCLQDRGQWHPRTGFTLCDLGSLPLQVDTTHAGNSELITFHGTVSLLYLMVLWEFPDSRSSAEGGPHSQCWA